ncbi:ketosteroid isomerase family protein [Egbenema bharatensis]|uniref:ketosteroid isomerase family protein n=1 Tax=Egbenema bharatensis TaxID=3463334 RepID=UPI003A8C87F5
MTHPLLVDDVSRFSVEKLVIERYFSMLNQGQFQDTAALFAADGVLFPPFDEPVVGQAAIVAYLNQEAEGMHITPKRFAFEVLPDRQIQVQVGGQVRLLVFEVSVSWVFVVNAQGKIEQVRVNLLASLEELLHLRSQPSTSPGRDGDS